MNKEDAKKILDYYISIKKPDYAVEITGDWGTGKTFFIKDYINEYPLRSAAMRMEKWKRKTWIRIPKKAIPFLENFVLQNPFRCILYIPLFSIKEESEIERKIWIEALLSNRLKFFLTLLFVLLLSYSTYLGIEYGFVTWDKLLQTAQMLAPALLIVCAWFYKTFKGKVFKLLLLGNTIVFDDFERASIDHELLLAYINRFVEHLNKHIIIVCNEDEIKEDSQEAAEDDSRDRGEIRVSSFLKIREKTVGRIIALEQDTDYVLQHILDKRDFPCLKKSLADNLFPFEWFVSVTTPEDYPVNYRVWERCCEEFERIFGEVDETYMRNKGILKSLIMQFFPLYYGLLVHDFGNGVVFYQDTIDNLYTSIFFDRGSRIWYRNWFPYFYLDGLLSNEIWNSIVFNRSVTPAEIESYWIESFSAIASFYHTIACFNDRNDSGIEHAWIELESAFGKHSVRKPAIIVQIFVCVLEMISQKRCPQKDLLPKKAFAWTRLYCKALSFDPDDEYSFLKWFEFKIYSDCLEKQHEALLNRCLNYLRHKIQCSIQRKQTATNYRSFLNALKKSANNAAEFYETWNNNHFDTADIFSNQDAKALLDALLSLPEKVLKDRIKRVFENLKKSDYKNTPSYVKFRNQFFICIQNKIDNPNNYLAYGKRAILHDALDLLP